MSATDASSSRHVETWPTSTASDAGSSGDTSSKPGSKRNPGRTLTDAAVRESWPSPRAEDSESCGNHPGASDSLTGAPRFWPTPRSITGGGESAERKKELGREDSGGGDLQAAAETWPTPNARDHKGADIPGRHGGASLSHFAEKGERIHSSPQAPPTPDGAPSSRAGRTSPPRLNPRFVEWLMGWPPGWSEIR